jgi:hypothetical protein
MLISCFVLYNKEVGEYNILPVNECEEYLSDLESDSDNKLMGHFLMWLILIMMKVIILFKVLYERT